jgi:surface carbohydrate biosynthesis protein
MVVGLIAEIETIMTRYLYIPLEIYKRELRGMMILSIIAAKNDWTVIIGGKKLIFPNLQRLPEGLILLKSIVPGEISNQKKLMNYGHEIISLDAEGLIFGPNETAVTVRFSKETIELTKAIFFWGKYQFDRVLEIYPEIKRNGFISGSPVFDYWRFSKRTKKKTSIKRKKRILIATSFPVPNHVVSPKMAKTLLENTVGDKSKNPDYLNAFMLESNLQSAVFPYFTEFVLRVMEKYDDQEIIIRPHHAESSLHWEKLAKKFPNVEVTSEGDIAEQMLKSDLLIHFNSTTAIEGAFYEKSILTFVPKNEIDSKLYNGLNKSSLNASNVAHTIEEGISLIDFFINSSHKTERLDQSDIIEGYHSQCLTHSSSLIIKSIESLEKVIPEREFPSRFSFFVNKDLIKDTIKQRISWIVGWTDHLTNLFGGRHSTARLIFKYGKSKQGRLPKETMDKEFYQLKNAICPDSGVKLHTIRNGLYKISKIAEGKYAE